MKATVFSADEWLYPDSRGGADSAIISCACNSFACWQMMVQAHGTVSVNVSGLKGLQIFQLLPVTVNLNSTFIEVLDTSHTPLEEMPKYHERKAPYQIFDPMLPLENWTFTADGSTALYFKWPTGENPGNHKGEIEIQCGEKRYLIPYEVTVHPVAVPKNETLHLLNWIDLNPKKYGCEAFTPAYWEVLEQVLTLARNGRQNYCNVTGVYVKYTYDGAYHFDFSRVQKYLDICFKLGFTKIEGPALNQIYLLFMQKHEQAEFGSEASKRALAQFLDQWFAYLCEKHYEEMTVQHVFDEPRDKNVHIYREMGELVHRHMPGIPTVDAVLSLDTENAADILIPTTRFYQLHRDTFEQYRKKGKRLWLYTCCWPSAPYLNRFLDMPLLNVRLLHWLNFLTGCDGYLHWGFCFNPDAQDQWKEPSIPFKIFDDSLEQFLPPGDTNIIYPYEGRPLGSVRLEMQRAGAEDYELLCSIPDQEKAMNIVKKCINEDFTGNLGAFREAWLELLCTF